MSSMEKKKYSVLIVDDELINIKALSQTLKPEYTVYAVINGHEALEAAEKHQPDIILLDIVMPDTDGYEILAALKSSGLTKHIPVIFLTSKTDPADEHRGLDLGAIDYILKPFSRGLLLKRLEQHLLLEALKQELKELKGDEHGDDG